MTMKLTPILYLLFTMTTVASADTPKAGRAEQLQFEVVLEAVKEDPALAPAALDVFRRVVENNAESITDEIEARFGMQPRQLRGPNSAYYFVRAPAFQAIGKLGTPEAIAYLAVESDSLAQSGEERKVVGNVGRGGRDVGDALALGGLLQFAVQTR